MKHTHRPLREYIPSQHDWKDADRIQAELHLMRSSFLKRGSLNQRRRIPFTTDEKAALFLGVCVIIAIIISLHWV